MFFPKPAYFGVRNAITNYFGKAVVLRDSSGQELVRFVENGNVLLMRPGAEVVEHANWAQLGLPSETGHEFIVRNAQGNPLAVVTENGNLYLAGIVDEWPFEGGETTPAFGINQGDTRESFIDDQGNLKMLGYLLVDGIPYNLREYEDEDPYMIG